jgi:hypothetical protein
MRLPPLLSMGVLQLIASALAGLGALRRQSKGCRKTMV